MRWSNSSIRWLALMSLVSSPVLSRDGGTKLKAPTITMPSFGEIPKGENLHPPEVETPTRPSAEGAASSLELHYTLVKLEHAKAFRSSASGHLPVGDRLSTISLSGSPAATEKFSTLIRVKSSQRVGAPIQIAILDPRGDPALSATGELSFRGAKGDEAEYVVDWDPTPCRAGGTYSVTVRVRGQELGAWPLTVLEPKKQ